MNKNRMFCLVMKEPVFWLSLPLLLSMMTLPFILVSINASFFISSLIAILFIGLLGYFITTPLIGLLTKKQIKSMYGPRTLDHIEKWMLGESADEKHDLDIESIARAYGELSNN
jgi:hypothetical protein